MNITVQTYAEALHARVTDFGKYAIVLEPLVDEFEINVKLRSAHFFAQIAHESAHFARVEENLNYSAERLRVVFPRYFPTDEIARQYHRQPEKIANRVYANRMGNGPEESGDGWRHRGMGLIQLTGKENQNAYWLEGSGESGDLDAHRLLEPYHAARSACWYWHSRRINELADLDDCVGVTKRINGGVIGLEARQALTNNMKALYGI